MTQLELQLEELCADLQTGHTSKRVFCEQLDLLLIKCPDEPDIASLAMALSSIH